MCRRSLSLSGGRVSPGSASGARATAEQPLKSVNPGCVAIAPLDFEPIGTNQGNRDRPDIRRYGGRVQDRAAAHLLHASCTRTSQAQVAGRKEAFMAALVPFNTKPVVLAIDGVGNGVWRHEYS
jgi:hypothetical protein